jgi:hypothetical protein
MAGVWAGAMAMAMAMERAELSVKLSLERMSPVGAAPALQGQSSPAQSSAEAGPQIGQRKSRRRPPPSEPASAGPDSTEATSEELAEGDSERTPHRVDSLA